MASGVGYAWLPPSLTLTQRGRECFFPLPFTGEGQGEGTASSSGGPHPHPPPAGEGIEAGEVNPFPSGFLSFPLWGKAGMGAGYDLKHG